MLTSPWPVRSMAHLLKSQIISVSFADDKMKQYLKKLDISLESLPDKQRELISHYASAKKETELHALETSYFEEWFLLRCEKKFNDMELIDDLSLTVAKYQEELDEDNRKITQLEAFLNDHAKPSEQSDNELVVVEQKLAGATSNFVSGTINCLYQYLYAHFQEEVTRQEPPYCLDTLIEKLNELQK